VGGLDGVQGPDGPGALATLGGLALVVLLVGAPGWAAGRRLGARGDLFARVLWGVATVSLVGLALAYVGRFTLPALLAGVGAATLLLALAGRAPEDGHGAAGGGSGRALAAAAGLLMVLWCWPPFETVLGGSDSTMYVNAGIHLARTGALAVEGEAARLLGEETARGLFPSIGALGSGPFIRLPGGLLSDRLTDDRALPAFFPLLPIWTGVGALAWGERGAPAIAPLAAGLAVWAVTLFAVETVGPVAGLATALLLMVNFALWWFGRFLMPEPLACALVWGALVLLARGLGGSAGLMLGLATAARAETLPFALAAVVPWALWTRPRPRLLPFAAGFVPPAVLAVASLVALPSHHLAYLRNDLGLAVARAVTRAPVATGTVVVAAGVLVLAAAGVLAALRRGARGARVARAGAVLGLALAVALYVVVGGAIQPARSLAWLAAYCSWPLLALAAAGAVVLWRDHDETVRLALLLCAIVTVVFVLNPRVAAFHPWAIRRFVPIVIPGLVLGAAAAVTALAGSRLRHRGAIAALTLAALVVLEVSPVAEVRGRRFFARGFQTVGEIAEMMPRDALVVVDSRLADVQLQVPLWLAYGRESVVMGQTANWRATMYAFSASGRPTYWINHHLGEPPALRGLRFERVVPDSEVKLLLPDAPADGPPSRMLGHRFPLRVYRVHRVDPPPAGR